MVLNSRQKMADGRPKKIIVVFPDESIKVFGSITQASEVLGIGREMIRAFTKKERVELMDEEYQFIDGGNDVKVQKKLSRRTVK